MAHTSVTKSDFASFSSFLLDILGVFCSHVTMTPQKNIFKQISNLWDLFLGLNREKFILAILKVSALRMDFFTVSYQRIHFK